MFASLTSRLTLASVAAAPVIEKLGVRNAQLHLCAKSGRGKSACIKAAMSIFGNPMMLRQTFANTQKFLEDYPAKFKDLPIWVDEFQSLNKFARLNMDQQIYNFENGITRGRLNKDAEAKVQHYFKGVRITSGEQPITNFTSGQGAKNRVIELDFADIISVKDSVRIHKIFSNKQKAPYGHFGRKWIAWLSIPENISALEKFFDKIWLQIRKKAAKQNGYTGNMSDSAIEDLDDEIVGLIPSHVQMLATFYTALYGIAQVIVAEKGFQQTIYDLIMQDIGTFVNDFAASKITSNAERIVPYLISEVHAKDKLFQHQTSDARRIYAQEVGGDSLGIITREGDICIHASKLRPLLSSLGAESPDAIIRGLHELRIFDEGKSQYHAHQKHLCFDNFVSDENHRIDGWFYVIKADAEAILERRKDFALSDFAAG